MATATEWAWLAGFFDGEGSITSRGSNRVSGDTPVLVASLAQTSRAPLEKAVSIVGYTGIFVKDKATPFHKESYCLTWTGQNLLALLRGIYPYSVVKRVPLVIGHAIQFDRSERGTGPSVHSRRRHPGIGVVAEKFLYEALQAVNRRGPGGDGQLERVEKIYRLKLADVLAEAEERLRILSRPSRRAASRVG